MYYLFLVSLNFILYYSNIVTELYSSTFTIILCNSKLCFFLYAFICIMKCD